MLGFIRIEVPGEDIDGPDDHRQGKYYGRGQIFFILPEAVRSIFIKRGYTGSVWGWIQGNGLDDGAKLPTQQGEHDTHGIHDGTEMG